jgi:hypothetical protein
MFHFLLNVVAVLIVLGVGVMLIAMGTAKPELIEENTDESSERILHMQDYEWRKKAK